MFRILVSDKLGEAGLNRLAKEPDVEVDMKTCRSKAQLLEVIPDYHALIIRSATKVDEDVLNAAKNLRVVGRAGIGIDNVDVRAATGRSPSSDGGLGRGDIGRGWHGGPLRPPVLDPYVRGCSPTLPRVVLPSPW